MEKLSRRKSNVLRGQDSCNCCEAIPYHDGVFAPHPQSSVEQQAHSTTRKHEI